MQTVNKNVITYKYFQSQNDALKAHTPSDIIGHLEDIDFEKGTLNLVVGQNKTPKTIKEVVEAIIRQAGCVSNPSALEDWKGFKPVKVVVQREIKIKVVGIETKVFIVGKDFKYEYPLGDMLNKLKVWYTTEGISPRQMLELEIKALDRYLESKGMITLNPMETEQLVKVFLGK